MVGRRLIQTVDRKIIPMVGVGRRIIQMRVNRRLILIGWITG